MKVWAFEDYNTGKTSPEIGHKDGKAQVEEKSDLLQTALSRACLLVKGASWA